MCKQKLKQMFSIIYPNHVAGGPVDQTPCWLWLPTGLGAEPEREREREREKC